jgi:hypothetical protein
MGDGFVRMPWHLPRDVRVITDPPTAKRVRVLGPMKALGQAIIERP